MATYTITTAVNIDTLAAKAGSDTYNINGGYLTIDQDTRYGTNQNTSAGVGNIVLSATLGGTLEVNSTKVRLIPYNTGTGNVPAYDTVISQGSASGILIGVYATLGSAPTAPAAAMPASGFIKIRQWNSVAYAAGALTGIGANATAADRPGWLEIVGVDALTITSNRLNNLTMTGDWFDFMGATTDGVRATTYQIPSNGTLVYTAGVWVETGVASGVYEFYACAGSLAATSANMATDSLRGKKCWIDTAGLLRFGHDGTNSTGGYIPPAGLRLRIANIFLTCCTAAARTVNVLPNATLATRYEFATTGGGVVNLDKVMTNWYLNSSQAYSLDINNTGIITGFVVSETASEINWTNVHVGQEAANTQYALNMLTISAGGTLTDCSFTRAVQATSGTYVALFTGMDGFTFINCKFMSLVKAANAGAGSIGLNRVSNSTLTNTTLGGGRLLLTTCTNIQTTDTVYYDHPALNTLSLVPFYAFELSTVCTDCTFDGLAFGGLHMTQPYSGILNIGTAGFSNIILKNIGTYASPQSLGSPRVDDAAWTRVTTTATVTSVAHGLEAGNSVYVVISSSTGAIIVGLKVILTVPTPDTFTFTCLNAGSASGTLCYFGTTAGLVVNITAGAVANNVKVQRVYAPHTRTNLIVSDNSSKNITLENVFSDYLNVPLFPMINGFIKNASGTPSYTAQTGTYGTHWSNGYVCDVAANTTSQAYTRATTTVTVTSAGHALRTGMLITVDPSVAPTTFTAASYSVTCLTSDTFTITVANAGAASGNLDYRVANGRIALAMNEATEDTVSQYTINAGNPAFTSVGSLFMPTIGDQITFETPDYIIGQGNTFPPFEAVMGGSTLTRYTIQYSLDKNDGNGYGTFHNLYYERTGGGGTSGATTVTMTSTSGVEAGDYIWGTGISPRATVISVDSATNITVSANNIATVSGTLRFNHLPSETSLDPDTGIKMKWRITTVTTDTVAITSLYIQAESTVTGRAYQYPLTTANATFSFSGLEIGTEVVLFNSSNVELDRQVLTGTDYEYSYVWNSDDGDSTGNYALIWKDDKFPIKFTNIDLTDTDLNVPISQPDDLVYETGGSSTPLTINYGSKLIIMDSGTVEMDIPETYSKWKDDILLTNNAQYDFAFTQVGGNEIVSPKSIPKYAFQANGWKARPQEANHTLNVTNGILVGESGADPFVNTLGAYTVRINYEQPVQAITVATSGSSFTPAEMADAVWDEVLSGHLTAGTTGKKLNDNLTQNNFLALK